MSISLRYAARTDIGLGSKSRNEDSGYAGPDLLVLADGMGGHAAGDMASSTVVSELISLDGESYGSDEALRRLATAVHNANARLRDEMDEDPELEGMGTTLIAFLRSGNMLALANIGDSRAYLVRDGVFSQITKDHSFVQTLLDDGRITAQEAEHHPQRSLVTRVLTGREDDEPDLSLREAKPGDRLLLCSDGLPDYVAGSTIEEIITGDGTPAQIADALIAIALKAATRDNVTVVVADVMGESDGPSNTTTPQIVGAAAAHDIGADEQDEPTSPAAKAAALSRAANAPAPSDGDEDDDAAPMLAEEGPRRFTWLKRTLVALLVLAVLAVIGVFGYAATQRQYYIAQHKGKVTIYQGISQNLGPIRLHSVNTVSDVWVDDLPSYDRSKVSSKSMTAGDREAAIGIVENLRSDMVACQAQVADGSSC
ncbi:serine/threonine protein phosphatase [Flexivirga endophytica]|uniref:Serine/threonine protein phosphatase n=1 Tax=Flexivirga endophytica TaxID=1849103 RepID=A0A916SY58_9MICO|nr:protein phosphatase 2C domain-containing protein [Flexivirga endophytica]GGB22437.1 serine/threonine protein phosphatase [Flexivirga endophytica]GHB56372.1 serine/threonine protein phosphatase [Flexivirga endophytica]